ncbi:hypothetical protein K440DRAFT_663646 [Wilcoxina mikolae CBS 423.85]|nr:hypothetical protein K440DRAFT_663646 [Wilcoxina mikolae CBS 423.85]
MSETHLQQTQTPHHSSHHHSHNHNNLSSSIHRTRSTSSITAADSKANNGDGGSDHTSRQHKPKQFVVSRHGHNPRVPSFGRGLNKLGNKQHPQHATPPKREGSGRTSARKGGATFELGSPTGSTTDGGNSYKDEPEVPPPIARTGSNNRLSRTDSNNNRLARTDSNNRLARTDSHNGNLPHNTSVIGLQKSSSTRSLDHESRKHRATRRGTTSTTDKATTDRARSKSGDCKRQQQQQQQQQQQTEQAILHKQQQQRRAKSPDALTEMMARAAMVPVAPPPPPPPPPQSQQQHPTSIATAIATPPSFHNPITPAHSLPSQEPLTSRFIHASPSSGADSAPNKRGPPTLTRSESTYSITSSAAPSRTQQKLWLQRAAVDAEPSHIPPATMTPHPLHGRDYFVLQAARAEKEYDRVGREYLNVRRFKNPLGEAVDRVREMQARRGVAMKQQRPTTGDAAAIAGGKLGLSRSLQEGDARRGGAAAGRIGNANVMRRGSRDDLGVDGRSGEVEAALDRLWRREMLVSTNND